jgi:hypothetical protein
MSDDANIDLRFIGQQLKRLSERMDTLHDDMGVLTAIITRMDGTVVGLVNEMRAVHSQQSRVANRLKALEDTREPK